eukprot:scaffold344_cov215-Prasinococcus_capsulatus_cf.AAC.4
MQEPGEALHDARFRYEDSPRVYGLRSRAAGMTRLRRSSTRWRRSVKMSLVRGIPMLLHPITCVSHTGPTARSGDAAGNAPPNIVGSAMGMAIAFDYVIGFADVAHLAEVGFKTRAEGLLAPP